MIVAAKTRGKGIRSVRHRGIMAALAELGVCHSHLYRVIRGERRSPRLEAWLAKNLKEEAR
jgi:hypothetical protein